jgi:hypothetical protein
VRVSDKVYVSLSIPPPPRVLKFVTSTLFPSTEPHSCACYRETQYYPDSACIQREVRAYRISVDTLLFLETIVHFHGYTCYKALHTGRQPPACGPPILRAKPSRFRSQVRRMYGEPVVLRPSVDIFQLTSVTMHPLSSCNTLLHERRKVPSSHHLIMVVASSKYSYSASLIQSHHFSTRSLSPGPVHLLRHLFSSQRFISTTNQNVEPLHISNTAHGARLQSCCQGRTGHQYLATPSLHGTRATTSIN